MTRLILLSGIGGAGTSTLCAATAATLEDEGLSPCVVDATTDGEVHPAVASLAAAAGRVFAEVGADPVDELAWSLLPGVGRLSALARIQDALSDPSVDAVVVDAGDLGRARELITLPAILTRLLDSTLTPRLAMWRASDTALFDELSAARATLLRWSQSLARPATSMRLVTRPDADAVDRTGRALAVFAMLGVGVDGVIVNRFPRRSEASSAERSRADQALAVMTELADGVEVWRSTSRIRAVPKGRSALGPLARVQVLDAEQLTVHVDDEDLRLELPLAGAARTEARVGRQGAQLVMAFDGCLRWIDLPPVLLRCQPTHAQRTPEGLRVHFTPDPATWRQPTEVAS